MADFSVDFILTSCCLILNAIAAEKDNDKGNVLDEIEKFPLPTNQPPSMAARYDVATCISPYCMGIAKTVTEGGCH